MSNGLSEKEFGLNFWSDILEQYTTLMQSSTTTDGDVSGHVKDKETYKAEVRKTLKALLLLIEANYPDNYPEVQRQWGFQRENY